MDVTQDNIDDDAERIELTLTRLEKAYKTQEDDKSNCTSHDRGSFQWQETIPSKSRAFQPRRVTIALREVFENGVAISAVKLARH